MARAQHAPRTRSKRGRVADDYVVLMPAKARTITFRQMMSMIDAFTAKAKNHPQYPPGEEDERLRSIVTAVVADTILVVDGTIPMESLENWQ